MTHTEVMETIVFPIINEEFKNRIPKETTLETRSTISGHMANLAFIISNRLQEDSKLDPVEVTKEELKIFLEDQLEV